MPFKLFVPLIGMLVACSLSASAANAVPVVNQPLIPASVAPGSGGLTLTVNGTGFVSGAVVRWNGRPRITSFVNSHQLTATILAGDVAAAQTATVTVANPATNEASNAVYFPVMLPQANVSLMRQDYLTGNGPACEATGDFNRDGNQDIALCVFGFGGGGYISVLLGYGDGFFPTPTATYPTGPAPLAIVTGDFNGDGKLDLATANSNGGSVSILLGNGDGTFQPRTDIPVGSFFTEGIATADFNHDGNLDLVVSNLSDGTMGVLLGNGNGTFQPVADYAVSSFPTIVVTGDFNGDGNVDFAVACDSTNTVGLFLGNGDGTFQPRADYAVGSFPLGLATADFNGDGILDLVTANDVYNAGTASVLLGQGDGTFAAANTFSTIDGPQSIAVGDFNGDGKIDVALLGFNCPVGCSDSTLQLWNGNGDGTFVAGTQVAAVNLGSYVVTADFNNDGKLDFVVGHYYSGETFSVILQTPEIALSPGVLTFSTQKLYTTSAAQNVTLTNNSSRTLSIASVTSTGDFSETNTCGTQVLAGASCTIAVSFTPRSLNTVYGGIVISDDGGTGTQVIHLSGYGSAAILILSRNKVNFAPTPVGGSSTQVVQLRNVGNQTWLLQNIHITGDFLESDSCGNGLLPNNSCVVQVTFKPTATGTRTGVLTIQGNGAPAVENVALSGTGD